jgi:uncharacterized protein YndB with AHSA1/START domain
MIAANLTRTAAILDGMAIAFFAAVSPLVRCAASSRRSGNTFAGPEEEEHEESEDAMTTVTVSSQIDAPVGRVFELFSDVEHATKHVSGIKGIEILTPGPFGPGKRWRETREVLGRLDSADMEVTAFDRNRGYTITHHKAGSRVDAVFGFQPLDRGTKVTIEFTLDGEGLAAKLLSPIAWAVSGRIQDVLSHDLADLKNSAERESA